MEIVLIVIVYFLGFIFGSRLGFAAGRITAAKQLKEAQDEISQTLKLAEMRGVNTSTLTAEQIIELVIKRRKELNENLND